MDVCLIYSHTFSSQAGGIVDRNVVQVRVLLPILVQDEQELLGSSKSECREKNMPISSDD